MERNLYISLLYYGYINIPMQTVREIVHPDAILLARHDVDELKAHIIWSSALKNGQEWTWGHSQIWWLVAMRKWMCKRVGRVLVSSHSLWLQHIQDSQDVFQTLSTLWSSVWHPKLLMIIFNISIWIHLYIQYVYIYIRISIYKRIYIYVISTYKRIYIYIMRVCVYCPITVQSSINRGFEHCSSEYTYPEHPSPRCSHQCIAHFRYLCKICLGKKNCRPYFGVPLGL